MPTRTNGTLKWVSAGVAVAVLLVAIAIAYGTVKAATIQNERDIKAAKVRMKAIEDHQAEMLGLMHTFDKRQTVILHKLDAHEPLIRE